MKVVYVKTILDKLAEAIHKSHRDNRKIEYIELDPCEFNDFRREMSHYHVSHISYRGCSSSVMDFAEFQGVKIRCR